MKTFKDQTGQEWEVVINVGTVKRVRDLAGVDLLDIVKGKVATELADDSVKLCEVIYALVKPQAEKKDLTIDAFLELMGGDSIDEAVSAFLGELVNFSPRRQRKILEKAIEVGQEVQELQTKEAEAKLSEPGIVAKVIKSIGGGKSTDLPESSE